MKKFSKINESKIDLNELKTILSELDGEFEYKILDYYTKSGRRENYLIQDIGGIEEGSKFSKVILIDPNFNLNRFDIDGWSEMGFNSSGFSFFKDLTETKSKYDKIFSILEKLSKYSPKLCVKDRKFIICLIGQELTQDDLNVKNEMLELYKYLQRKLSEFIGPKRIFKSVNLDNNYTLKVSIREGFTEEVLVSLCPHMAIEKGYEWMKKIKINDDLEDIADVIHDKSFKIQFISPKYSYEIENLTYQLKIVEL
jgi:hypothetical protein